MKNNSPKSSGLFITATDTGVGKTVATLVLASLLKKQGIDVGIMKPVQCAGDDAEFLVNNLDVRDELDLVNPFFAPEPLSPHLAFRRAKKKIDPSKIIDAYRELSSRHELTLVEGAGGLMVPLTENYLVADLIADLNLDVVIVSRLGLGTLNHTLLAIEQARNRGLNIKGVIFSQNKSGKLTLPEQTNPTELQKLVDVPMLGIIPHLKKFDSATIARQCQKINLKPLFDQTKNRTARLQELDKKYVWHPFTQMKDWLTDEPLVIDSAKGNYLIDTDGNKYIDGVSSLWVNVHGHRHKEINSAIKQQLEKVSHSTLLGLGNAPSIELAEKLIEIAPTGMAKVFYSDSGSTAVEIAIKMAYQYWQNIGRTAKHKIAHLANSYHGDTLGSVSVGGIDLFHQVYRDLVFETMKIDFPDCYRAPQGKTYPDYAFECLDSMDRIFTLDGKDIAAFIVEPIVQGAAGMIMWPEGVLKRMEEICRKYDVLFIVDEVATGFGRTGKMFACEQEDVHPDFLCLAKGITGGYLPLAATLTTQRIFDGFLFDYKDFKTFFHGHTYTGNPLACAAALASLKVFENERVLKNLVPKIKHLHQRLQMFYNLASVGDVRQRGMMVGIELVEDRSTKKPFPLEQKIGARVCQKVRERGVILRPLGNVIVLMPPLSILKQEIDQLLDVTYWAIEEIIGKIK